MKSFILLTSTSTSNSETSDDESIIYGDKSAQPSTSAYSSVNKPTDERIQRFDRGESAGGILFTLVTYIVLFLIAYWILVHPHKKRQEKIAEMQKNLKAGDDIVTASGLHGKIIEVNEETFLVEFGVNKGVRIPVSKQYVLSANETKENNQIEK